MSSSLGSTRGQSTPLWAIVLVLAAMLLVPIGLIARATIERSKAQSAADAAALAGALEGEREARTVASLNGARVERYRELGPVVEVVVVVGDRRATARAIREEVPVSFRRSASRLDLYRDTHKGIRAELFGGHRSSRRTGPSLEGERAALTDHVRRTVELLVSHAEHEDGHIQPALELHLPAMNIDDRTELLAGMRADAPPAVFDGIWRLAGSVLEPRDHRALAARLGR